MTITSAATHHLPDGPRRAEGPMTGVVRQGAWLHHPCGCREKPSHLHYCSEGKVAFKEVGTGTIIDRTRCTAGHDRRPGMRRA